MTSGWLGQRCGPYHMPQALLGSVIVWDGCASLWVLFGRHSDVGLGARYPAQTVSTIVQLKYTRARARVVAEQLANRSARANASWEIRDSVRGSDVVTKRYEVWMSEE